MSKSTIFTEQNRQQVLNFIGGLKIGEGKAWDVTVERHKKKRSLSQNSYLHLILKTVADETGNSIEDVKEAYKVMFLGYQDVEFAGKLARIVGSTTKLSTKEFADFVDQVCSHAQQELGIILPNPDELRYDGDGRAV